jgi:hypothetical protein
MTGQPFQGDANDAGASRRIVPLSESLKSPIPQRTPVVEGLLDRGELMVVAARPGTGKTPLVTQLANCVAGEALFLDLATTPGKVIHIDMESPPDRLHQLLRRQWNALGDDRVGARAAEQLRLFSRGSPFDPNSRELDRLMRLDNAARFQFLSAIVEEERPELVVIDTLLSYAPFKSSDEARVRDLYWWLSDIRNSESKPAIVYTVHLRKRDRRVPLPPLADDPQGWTEEILGSVVFSSSADVRLGMERTRDGIVLAGYRRGLGTINPMSIRSRLGEDGEPALWEPRGPEGLFVQFLGQTLSSYLHQIPIGVPLKHKDLLLVMPSPSTVKRLTEKAIEAGLMKQDEDGRYIRNF